MARKRGMDPEWLRAECAAAGVSAEVAEMVVLHHCQGMDWASIAKLTEIKPASVRDTVARAGRRLEKLRKERVEAEERAEAETVASDDPEVLSLHEEAVALMQCVKGPINHAPSTPLLTPDGERVTVRGQAWNVNEAREALLQGRRYRRMREEEPWGAVPVPAGWKISKISS